MRVQRNGMMTFRYNFVLCGVAFHGRRTSLRHFVTTPDFHSFDEHLGPDSPMYVYGNASIAGRATPLDTSRLYRQSIFRLLWHFGLPCKLNFEWAHRSMLLRVESLLDCRISHFEREYFNSTLIYSVWDSFLIKTMRARGPFNYRPSVLGQKYTGNFN